MKRAKHLTIALQLFVLCFILVVLPLHGQTSQVVYNNPEHTSGSLTLSAYDCTYYGWYYDWEITVPVNTPIKVTTHLYYGDCLDVYTYMSSTYQTIFYDTAPGTSTTTIISTTGSIYVYCSNYYGINHTSDVFTITFEVDSAIFSPTEDFHVPGKLSVKTGLDVFGDTRINNRLSIGTNTSSAKLYISNNQYNYAMLSFSSKSSSSSLYGLYSYASNSTGKVYGIYSTVSGATGKKWAGYFSGGDVAVMNGNVGIGVDDPQGILQVRGTNDNSWIYFSSNAGTSSTKYKPKVNYGLAFTWNYSGGDGESIINYSSQSGGSPRLDFTSYDGTTLKTEMSLNNGSLGIGTITIPANYKLAVAGKIIAEEVVISQQSSWPDFVFKSDYRLRPLHELEQFVRTNSHLPGIPSAEEVEENGLSMGEMQNMLLQKVEELTLYIIEQDKKIKSLEERLK